MKASKILWGDTNVEGLKSAPTYELLRKASIIYYPYEDRKLYSYFPIGQLVLLNLETLVRNKMQREGIQEIYLPLLQPYELWRISERDKIFKDRMMFIKESTKNKERYVLSPTSEEVATLLAKKIITSYKQLPLAFYQIADKFRDDPNTKRGIIRSNIFRILEAYSFNLDETCLENTADKFEKIFMEIFKELELDVYPFEKRKGYTTFIFMSDEGDTKIAECACGSRIYYPKMGSDCASCGQKFSIKKGIELGCVMREGKYYSEKIGAYYTDSDGAKKPIYLGTYGIGLSRVIHAVVAQKRDEIGIIWPEMLTPIQVAIIPIDSTNKEQVKYAEEIYTKLKEFGWKVILEDREIDKNLGWKVRFYDMIGVPLKIIIGQKEIENKFVTLQDRKRNKKVVPLDKLNEELIIVMKNGQNK
jgi:prolyl-tRNA synthetase